MKSRRLAVVGLSLVAALTFTAAGCSEKSDSDGGNDRTTNASPTADPAAELANAATEMGKTSFKLKMVMGDEGELNGVLDGPSQAGDTTLTIAGEDKMTIQNRYFGSDLYLKVDMGGQTFPGMDPKKWTHLDLAKLPEGNALGLKPGQYDPTGAALFMKAVASAQRVDAHNFTGTMDMSKAVGAASLTSEDVTKLGEKGKAVPFKATTDEQGRLVKMVIEMPAMGTDPAVTMTATYSDFGAKMTATKPAAGEITEAPDNMYSMFAPES